MHFPPTHREFFIGSLFDLTLFYCQVFGFPSLFRLFPHSSHSLFLPSLLFQSTPKFFSSYMYLFLTLDKITFLVLVSFLLTNEHPEVWGRKGLWAACWELGNALPLAPEPRIVFKTNLLPLFCVPRFLFYFICLIFHLVEILLCNVLS